MSATTRLPNPCQKLSLENSTTSVLAPIDGVKVIAANRCFAARPSGAEALCKIDVDGFGSRT